jgi:hypothetical protein
MLRMLQEEAGHSDTVQWSEGEITRVLFRQQKLEEALAAVLISRTTAGTTAGRSSFGACSNGACLGGIRCHGQSSYLRKTPPLR